MSQQGAGGRPCWSRCGGQPGGLWTTGRSSGASRCPEVMAVDGDAFDYIFYTYGLRLYGNMPLVEPPETKEEKRIEDFVIAVDTSMSTSGALVREFLPVPYAILRSRRPSPGR